MRHLPLDLSSTLFRAGRLVVVYRQHGIRSDPRLDGARVTFTRYDKRDDSTLLEFSAGGYKLRLPSTHRASFERVPSVTVAWRGARIPNPQWSRITAKGREWRRQQQAWRAAGAPRVTMGAEAGAASPQH